MKTGSPWKSGCRLALAWLFFLLLVPVAWAANVDVQIATFTDNPDPATRGGLITYTTVVKNGGPAVASNVVVTWPIPATTTFVSVNDGSGGGICVHDGLIPGQVTCTYPSVPVDDTTSATWKSVALVIRTTATTPGTITPSVSVAQTGDTDTNAANDSLGQNTTVNAGADLSFAISGAPNPSFGAGNVTWSINGSNLGPDTSGPITVTVPLSATLTYQSGSGTGWSCSYSNPNVTCTRAALAASVAYPALLIVTKITSQISGGTLTVGGSISETSVGDPVSSNDSATASVTVNPGLDLQITQDAASPASANAGGTAMTFVLRPINLGPYDATTGATVSFPLPSGFTLTSATGTNGWTCSSAGSPITVTCAINSNLASGAGSVVTIVTGTPATVSSSTVYTLTGTVSVNAGGAADQVAGNNTAARSVTVTPEGLDLSLTKSKSPAIVAQNANMTTTITVSSATGGLTAAAGTITVTDVLNTTYETYVSASGSNWSCSASALPAASQTVTCTYNAALSGGASASNLILTTQAMTAGTATNNASVAYSGSPGDYNTANDGPVAASVTVTAVPNSPDLVAGLAVSTPGGAATTLEANESTVTYTATLANSNATSADAVDTRMTLTIPARVTGTLLSAITVNVTNTSGLSTATYTCTAAGVLASSSIVCDQAAATVLKPGDAVTFTVPVSRPLVDGAFTNPPSAAVTSTTQGDPTPTNNTATASIAIDPVADIELVSKLITSANPARAGTDVTYVVTIRNNGPSSAAGVSMTDVFTIPGGDTGFTFISATASNSGTCNGLIADTSYTSGTPTLTCSWAAAIASAATRTATIVIRPNWMTGDPTRTLPNTASVTTTTVENPAGGDNGNNSQNASLTINAASADALINNTDIPDPLGYDPAAGGIGVASTNNDVTYDVAVTNNGPSLVSGLGFTYTMTPPAGKTVVFRGDGAAAGVAAANSSGTIAGSICNNVGSSVTGATLTLTCSFAAPGQLANGATTHRYLVFRVGTAPSTGGDTYATNATVVINETDSNPGNNSEGENTTVRQRVDLTIAKTPSINPAQMRQPFNWTITLTNVGPGNSDTTTLTDTLPAGMSYFGAAPSFTTTGGKSGNCTVVAQLMTCNISTGSASPFNVGEVATVTVPVRMTAYPSGGTTQNCATAVTDQVDPAVGNNTAVCTNLTVQRSSLSGRVFSDPNRDGIYAGSDVGLNAWTVTLTGTDVYGNVVNTSQTTAGSGANIGTYSFSDLSPSDATGYTVTETQLATYVNGPIDPIAHALSGAPVAGDQGSYSRGGLAGNTAYAAIKLAANQDGTNYNFPEVRRPGLSGRVYVDSNSNDTYTAGTDADISGATMVLRDAADLSNSVASAVTAANGSFSFTSLNPLLTYVLEEPLPTTPAGLGNRSTAVNVGTVGGLVTGTAAANTPAANTDRITGIDLSSGVDGINYNFGENLIGVISGTVYIDGVCNGVKDAADTTGVGSVAITLKQGADCTVGTVVQSTTTSASGLYSFAGVTAGQNYLVCKTHPVGYGNGAPVSNVIAVAPLAPAGSNGNDFGVCVGSIAGSVYRDYGTAASANTNNGLRDTGELGIVNVPVTLNGTDLAGNAVNTSTVTDASGNYRFNAVLQPNAAGYTLSEGVIPAASGSYSEGKDTAGNASLAVGSASAVKNQISGIRIAGGENATGYNFGELPPPVTSAFPDMVVTKTVNSQRVIEGQTISYTLTVKNAGQATTSGSFTVTDFLPSGSATPPKWSIQSASGNGWMCSIATNSLSMSCNQNAVLGAGEINSLPIAVTVKVEAGAAAFGPLRNVVQVTGGGEPVDKAPLPTEVASPPSCGATPEFNVCQVETPIEMSAPDLVVTKAAGKTVFTDGTTGTYTLRVKNIGSVVTSGSYTVTDTLPSGSGTPAKWSIQSAAGNGWACTIAADKLGVACTQAAVLQPGDENPSAITVGVKLESGASALGTLRNTVAVSGGGEPDGKKPQPNELAAPKSCGAAPEFNVCKVETALQRPAGLNGHVWIDGVNKKILDTGDKRLPQWIVEIYDVTDPLAVGKPFAELVRSGIARRTTTTNGDGYYEVCDLEPNSIYRVLFRDPANRIAFPGVVTNEQGRATGAEYWSQVKDREGFQVLEVKLPSATAGTGCAGVGISAPEQSLPLDPNGVVYNALTRKPVLGAKVTLKPEGQCTGYDPQKHVINYETYSKDASGNPTMTTGEDGFYKFLLSGDPSAPKSCQFRLAVEQPLGYKPPPSSSIVPSAALGTPAAPGIYEVQAQKIAPAGNQSTTYHFLLMLGLNHQEVFNNHVPLDPLVLGKLLLTKTGDKRLVEVGDSLLYTVTVRLLAGDPAPQVTVRDRLPAGFTLIPGTVRLNAQPAPNPMGGVGPVLGFNLNALQPNAQAQLSYRVRVEVGAMQGTGINTARAHACPVATGCLDGTSLQSLAGTTDSNEGQYKVEVTGGVFTDEACVLGKVFVDCSGNHVQDPEELGVPGVRLYFEDGRFMVSDSEGKYSRCGLSPRSHVLVPDPSTLPRGARLTTSSNRNLGDANSLFLDIKKGELHRADFIEGSCSNGVLEHVKARRAQGEVRSVETESPSGPALRFIGKPRGLAQQGTDSANQPLVQPRQGASDAR